MRKNNKVTLHKLPLGSYAIVKLTNCIDTVVYKKHSSSGRRVGIGDLLDADEAEHLCGAVGFDVTVIAQPLKDLERDVAVEDTENRHWHVTINWSLPSGAGSSGCAVEAPNEAAAREAGRKWLEDYCHDYSFVSIGACTPLN